MWVDRTYTKLVYGTAILLVLIIAKSFSQPEPLVRAQTKTSSPKQDADAGLTPSFKKQAWRAIDAIDRINLSVSANDATDATKAQIIEARKAIDEAKYEASTSLDLMVLHSLQMAINSVDYQISYRILDPEWKKHNHRALQCQAEAKYYVNPTELSDYGKSEAKKATCNKETDEWGPGISE